MRWLVLGTLWVGVAACGPRVPTGACATITDACSCRARTDCKMVTETCWCASECGDLQVACLECTATKFLRCEAK